MKKSTLPVSEKFYNQLSDRITSAANAAGIDSKHLMATVNDYIASGMIPYSDADPLLQLAFALLRPEIDKAKERSQRARQRRKPATGTSGQNTPEHEETTVIMNRRQRRLIEQALKRSARKSVKRSWQNNAGLPAKGIRRGYKENDSIVA